MKGYKQLGYEERVEIAKRLQAKSSITEIAIALGRSTSTISREIRRNQAPPGEYWPDTAKNLASQRRFRGCLLDRDADLREFVLTQLQCHYWTPEQIAGYLKRRQKKLRPLSHETLYAWLYRPAQRREKLWKFLPRHKAKRGLRKSVSSGVSRIPDRVSLHDRPKSVEKRRELGHWEGDLMAFRKNSQHILVLRERKTMYALSLPLESKKATETSEKLIALMKDVPPHARRTLTLDNGGEFAAHKQWLQALNLPSFFCDPYASWQKGGVENTNGRLRRDLPRNTDVKTMNPQDFNEIIQNYNLTPRKNLKWLTPLEAFNKNLSRVAL